MPVKNQNPLTDLGFTELESTVYLYLVEYSPATPYRVAKAIGKPVANTYKAVEDLRQKGAVLVDETHNRLCQAVPPAELLGKLKETWLARHEAAAEVLSKIKPSGDREKIFTLRSAEQVLDTCKKLMENAGSVILADAFPGVVDILKPWLKAAAARSVTTVLQTYGPAEIEGVEVVPYQAAELSLRRWPGQWLIVVVDGAEYLFAYLNDDATVAHQAIWCGSAFLALPQHSNLAIAFRAAILEQLVKEGASLEQMRQALKRTERWLVLGTRGYNELAAKFSYRQIDK
jgi:sugar-specific transcriptional regulator TrmB